MKTINSKKLKICHVITRMIIGGAQENTLLSVIGLADKGHEVILLTGPTTGPEGKLLEKNIEALSRRQNIEIIEYPTLVREIHPIKDIKAYFGLKAYFKKSNFDVVHTHSSKAGIIGRAAAWAVGVPFVVHTIHGQAFHKYERWWKNGLYILLERYASKKCHRILAVAQAMIDQAVDKKTAKREKCKVVYSGMEIESFLNAKPDLGLKKKLGIKPDALVVGTLARLFHLKGYEHIVKIAGEVIRKVPNTIFLLIGDGILRDTLKKEIADAKLKEHFVFAGLISPEKIPNYLSIVDALVHLSLREGLPRSVVQSLASSKPAVAFNLDGTPEVLINGKTGYIAEPHEIGKVTNCLITLLSEKKLREEMGKSGREFVRQKFDWKTMVNELELEYFNALLPNIPKNTLQRKETGY